MVTAKGTIIEGNEGKKSVKIDIGGETLELKADGDTKIASGYTPAKGDVVEVKYGKSELMLKSIKLLERAPEPEPEAEGESYLRLETAWLKA